MTIAFFMFALIFVAFINIAQSMLSDDKIIQALEAPQYDFPEWDMLEVCEAHNLTPEPATGALRRRALKAQGFVWDQACNAARGPAGRFLKREQVEKIVNAYTEPRCGAMQKECLTSAPMLRRPDPRLVWLREFLEPQGMTCQA